MNARDTPGADLVCDGDRLSPMRPVESPFAMRCASLRSTAASVTPFALNPPKGAWVRAAHTHAHAPDPSDHPIHGWPRVVTDLLASTDVRALVVGGIGSPSRANQRRSDDIDLLVHADDIEACVDRLTASGFETERTASFGQRSAFRAGVSIEFAVGSIGGVHLDDDMLDRAETRTSAGVTIRTVAPEDLVVISALRSSEHRSQHWYEALEVIARCELDWAYFTVRARRSGPRRILSLLLYAESSDLPVPATVVEHLFDAVHPRPSQTG